jgi:acetylornithine deacetylase/succinyl-diaminopimelate desuccinylase-like protein
MAERARTQRAEPIVRLGRRQEKPLDNLEQVGTEVPSPIRSANNAEGQLFIRSKALKSYPEAGSAAPVNVKFSALGLAPFIKNYLSWLKAYVCVISDSSMCAMEQPPLTHRRRGMARIQVEVLEPRDALHSGFWGGATDNPALALVEIPSKLSKPDNTIAVPGFHDGVVWLKPDERTMIAKAVRNYEEQCKKTTSVPPIKRDQNYTILERVSPLPKLDINGFGLGYSGPGPKTVIPDLPEMQPRRAHMRKRGDTSQFSRVLTVVSQFVADVYHTMKTSGVMMG